MVLFDKENNYEIGYSSLVDSANMSGIVSRFRRHSDDIVHAVCFMMKDGVTWLGGTNGLIRYDSKIISDYEIPFNALIRNVTFGDSLLFGGAYQEGR